MSTATETLGQTLIPLINKLQDVFMHVKLDATLDLPQVAVVGTQSSGKSSVLEALVGKDFLPRGNTIVTRRPLILQLIRHTHDEWGEFLHVRGKKFYDFGRIRHEIQAETERSVPTDKGISGEPIRLRVFSPHVLTMTLVDLPGMTRVPVGDQPVDIEKQVRRLILKYISAPSCIILAVSPANQDLSSSDALELAKKVDPDGVRTIGVLTKLDIMDRGTDAVSMLKNDIVPLKLGYVGVVLRSQQDIINSTSMDHAREAERMYFRNHREYDAVSAHCTVGVLAHRLNGVLVHAIRERLPSLRQAVESALEKKKKESRVYGDAPPGSTGAARGAMLLSILDSYTNRLTAALEGRGEHVPLAELAGGARIRHIFLNVFNPILDAMDPASELTDDEIRTAITNSGGITGSLMIPEAPFELLVRRAIQKLLHPALQCREYVHDELLRIAAECAPSEVARFPKLQACMMESVEDFIALGASPAEKMIRNLIQCELSYINTSNPRFIGGNEAIAHMNAAKKPSSPRKQKKPLPQKEALFAPSNAEGEAEEGKQGWFQGWFSNNEGGEKNVSLQRPPDVLTVSDEVTEHEVVQVQVSRLLINSYFDIVRKNIQDMVPKILMNFLVNHVQRGLQKHLTHVLYREDLLEAIMKEREDIAERRQSCQETIKSLRKAMRLLDSMPSDLSSLSSKASKTPTTLCADQNVHAN
ncbi:hypothetical protein M9435_005093 [Picochlorum sp. BPE23]|nr:hypothetical protein M9435_005093 [Picochlorum sp. BPE23]